MNRPILPALPPALTGIGASLPPRAPALPGAAGPERASRAGLDVAGWREAPAVATVRGDLPYPGDAADVGAVAESIAALLFDRA
jgi:hypothetical protein